MNGYGDHLSLLHQWYGRTGIGEVVGGSELGKRPSYTESQDFPNRLARQASRTPAAPRFRRGGEFHGGACSLREIYHKDAGWPGALEGAHSI